MEYPEEDYLLLSGIQHYSFCPRQWALIHIEQQWDENVKTVEGELLHKKVHDESIKEVRKGVIITRSLRVASRSMGVSGSCDVVEFVPDKKGISISGHDGLYKVFPVEYKRGKPKQTEEDILQLAAEAMCLEEMLVCTIDTGYLYYGETRHREKVQITFELKEKVKSAFREMHELLKKQYTPKQGRNKKCSQCSISDLCLPKMFKTSTVQHYIEDHLSD